jgi:hypothetical protein
MIKWVVGTMRNVKIAIETVSLHGWEYNPANQLHHKKPGASMMHRDLTEQVGGGGKTAKKPASAPTPPLCNICGGNHTTDACRRKRFPDTNPDVSVRVRKDEKSCHNTFQRTYLIGKYVKALRKCIPDVEVDQFSPKQRRLYIFTGKDNPDLLITHI